MDNNVEKDNENNTESTNNKELEQIQSSQLTDKPQEQNTNTNLLHEQTNANISTHNNQSKLEKPQLSSSTQSTATNIQNSPLVFQTKLQEIISTQEAILQMTFTAKEKLHSVNEITSDQINTFKQSTKKYGIYLSLIKNELQTITETIRKIKKLKK